ARWMEGGNLRTLMAKRDPETFFRTMSRIVGALDWAYTRHRILHRDLKPENLLLDERGRPAVSDWGIAQPSRDGEPPRSTRRPSAPGSRGDAILILGTVSYSSPEQLLGGVPLDPRSDIYSLGCVMYEWETGKPPFSGTWHEIRERKIKGEPPRISGIFRRS